MTIMCVAGDRWGGLGWAGLPREPLWVCLEGMPVSLSFAWHLDRLHGPCCSPVSGKQVGEEGS